MVMLLYILIMSIALEVEGRAPNRFSLPAQLYPWDDLGLNGVVTTKSRVVAFADVNGDKKVDLIVVTESRRDLNIYLWAPVDYRFNGVPSWKITLPDSLLKKIPDIVITSVSPADFNYDGQVDLLVQGRSNANTGDYFSTIFIGDAKTGAFTALEDTLTSSEELLVLDMNSDLIPDLFGWVQGKRRLWLNDGTGHFQFELVLTPATSAHMMHVGGRPHTYVDLNGDCVADLAIAAQTTKGDSVIEIYHWDATISPAVNFHFKYSQTVLLAPGGHTGPVTFVDADLDGNVDMVYASDSRNIVTHYNKQMGMCASAGDCNCREKDKLCTGDAFAKFDDYVPAGNVDVVVNALNDVVLDEAPLLREGDLDADGLPELLIKTAGGSILMYRTHATKSGFEPVTDDKITAALAGISNAVAAAFFDLNDDGVMDVLIMDQSASPIKFLFNNLNLDSLFFKTLVSNGVCPEGCEGGDPLIKPYGVSQAGVTVRMTVADENGDQKIRTGGQMKQSSYGALYPPYVYSGLARTYSYVEMFSVGISNGKTHQWPQLIPNCQIVVFPYKPSTPDDWLLEQFLSPASNLAYVTLSVLAASAALCTAIAILHWKHLKSDMLKQRRAEHFFTF